MKNERIGRNETCTCGSGKKYKACCGAKLEREAAVVVAPQRSPFPWSMVALGVVVLGMGAYAAIQLSKPEPANTDATAVTAPGVPPMPMPKIEFAPQTGAGSVLPGTPPPALTPTAFTPQPPGEAPPGKVWSPEHGHWHDQVTETTTMGALTGAANPAAAPGPAPFTPQPAGPVPEGKEWSAAHGHWHDVVTQTTTIQAPVVQGGVSPMAPNPTPTPAPAPAPEPAPAPAPAPDATPPK